MGYEHLRPELSGKSIIVKDKAVHVRKLTHFEYALMYSQSKDYVGVDLAAPQFKAKDGDARRKLQRQYPLEYLKAASFQVAYCLANEDYTPFIHPGYDEKATSAFVNFANAVAGWDVEHRDEILKVFFDLHGIDPEKGDDDDDEKVEEKKSDLSPTSLDDSK